MKKKKYVCYSQERGWYFVGTKLEQKMALHKMRMGIAERNLEHKFNVLGAMIRLRT